MKTKRAKVLGFDVDIISFDDVIQETVERIKNKQGTHIITINPEIIEEAQKNDELANILNNAEIVVADGVGIKLALKLKGIEQERIPGIDLAAKLIEQANKFKFRTALIGAKKSVNAAAEQKIRDLYPNIDICYTHHGYFQRSDDDTIIKELKRQFPNLILVALGSPKQELFIQKCRKEIPDATYIGIGGSFDVWAGVVERAPEFFIIMNCEWIYRTFKQPQRLKRIYKTLPLFAIKAIIEARDYNKKRKGNVKQSH